MADVRKPLRHKSASGTRRCLSAFALALVTPTLTGCPLSDDYYVDDSLDDGDQATGGNGGGTVSSTEGAGGSAGSDSATSTTGGGGSEAGGASSTDGAGGSSTEAAGGSSTTDGGTETTGGTGGSGAGGSSTSGGLTCDPGCNAGRACSDGSCEGGWVAMAEPPADFVARQRAASVAFEGKVFVFGGVDENGEHLDSGAIYDPQSDTWTMIAEDDATPSPRELSTAVWTGTHIMVIGGSTGTNGYYFSDVALYDPDAEEWTTIDSTSTPRAKGIAGVVDGAVVLLQGMTTYGETEIDPERYDLDSESWSLAGDPGDLPGLWSSAIGFGDDSVFVFAGNSDAGRTDAAYRYDVAGDFWTNLPSTLSDRSGSFGVWDGANFYVFGGHDTGAYNDGAVFVSDEWEALPETGAPSPRRAPPAWTGWGFPLGRGDFAVMGGADASDNLLVDGGRFRDASGWEAIEAWPSREAHAEGVGVWTGEEFVLFSGAPDGDGEPTLTGERWAP